MPLADDHPPEGFAPAVQEKSRPRLKPLSRMPVPVLMLMPALAAALPMVALVAALVWSAEREAREQAGHLLHARVDRLANDSTAFVTSASRAAQFLAGRKGVATLEEAPCLREIAGFEQLDPVWKNAAVLRPDGSVVCELRLPGARTRHSYAESAWLPAVLASGRAAVGNVELGIHADAPVMYVASAIRNDQGRAIGAAAIEIDLKEFSERMGGGELPPGSSLGILDTSRRILARHPDSAKWIGLDAKPLESRLPVLSTRRSGMGVAEGADGIERLFIVEPIGPLGWTAVVGIPSEMLQAPVWRVFANSLGALAVALAIGVALAFQLARRISLPLKALASTAEAMGDGDSPLRVRVPSGGELRTVALQFNRMLDRQHEAAQRLRHASALYEALARANGAVVRGGVAEDVAAEVCRACVDTGFAMRMVVFLVTSMEDIRATACAGERAAEVAASIVERWRSGQGDDNFPLPIAMRTRSRVVWNDYSAVPAAQPYMDRAQKSKLASLAVLPLPLEGSDWGAVLVHSDHKDWFDEERLRLFGAVADDLGHVVRNQQAEAERVAARAARMAAEASDKAKSLFLANISHELRTPIHAIVGYTQLALRTQLDAEQYAHVQKTAMAADSLLALVDQILDLSNLEAGKLKPSPMDFQLSELVEPLRAGAAQRAAARGLEFRIELDAQLPTRLRGDRARLQRVLAVLAGNAVKFTNAGEIVVQLRAQARERGRVQLAGSVTDTGIGMTQEELGRVFEPFEQADASLARAYGGSGLGLAIARRLLQLLGGTLEASSTKGRGSEFRFAVWLDVLEEEPASLPMAPVSSSLRGQRVLVVDDNFLNLELASVMLHELGGLEVSTADSGTAALAALEAGEFDLVLMDLQMPVMDGYAAARAIRERKLTSAPVVGLSAYVTEEVRDACIDAGMEDCLGKAGGEMTLLESLARVLDRAPVR